MAAGLFLHALARVDEDQGGIGRGGAGNHVPDEFPVPRCVDQHVLASFGPKPDLGRVDRDVLIALRLKCVGEIRQLERDTTAPGDGNQLLVLALEERARVEQEPSNQRGLSVVNVTYDDQSNWSIAPLPTAGCIRGSGAPGSHVPVPSELFERVLRLLVLSAA